MNTKNNRLGMERKRNGKRKELRYCTARTRRAVHRGARLQLRAITSEEKPFERRSPAQHMVRNAPSSIDGRSEQSVETGDIESVAFTGSYEKLFEWRDALSHAFRQSKCNPYVPALHEWVYVARWGRGYCAGAMGHRVIVSTGQWTASFSIERCQPAPDDPGMDFPTYYSWLWDNGYIKTSPEYNSSNFKTA